jgi:hypothetical protein
MTDSASLIANQQALSSDVLYNMKPSVVRCRSYRASIPSSNKSTFAPSDTVIAYVPCRRNCFLDTANSYIRFTIKNTDEADLFYVDNTASSFINRLDVYHGSNLLETVGNYDVLTSYLADFQLDQAKRYGLETAFGCTTDRKGSAVAATARQTFCVPLFSGTVGVMNDKFLPLSLADDIRLEFTLNSALQSVCWAASVGVNNWSCIGFELELTILELSDEGMRMVEAVTPFDQPIYMHGTSYRHYSSNVPATSSGQQSFLVPARFASLKSLICCPRVAATNVLTAYTVGSRINPNIDSYWWRLGSLIVPQKAVNLKNTNTTGNYSEGYIENLRAWHSINNPLCASALSAAMFNVADAADTNCTVIAYNTLLNSYKNAFAIAQELESISNRGDVILSGVNTLNQQIFFEFANTTAIGASSYTLDFFANYDHILVLDENGLLSIKF